MTEPVDPNAPAWQPPDADTPPPGFDPNQPGNLGYTPAEPPPLAAYGAPQVSYQPYPGQPYPGQPYPGQPYPGQPYAGQPYPGPPPYPQFPAEPPPKTRRNKVIIAAVLVVVLGAGGLVAVLLLGHSTSKSTSSSMLPLPPSVGPYQALPGATADQFRTNIRQSFGTSGVLGKFFSSAAIGAYGEGAEPPPKLILIAAHASDYPQLRATSLGSSALGTHSYPAGAHGGAVECFNQSIGTIKEVICFWSDTQSVGYLLSLNAPETTAEVAALLNNARDTLEH